MTWGPKAQNPAPDWTMSAALASVPRGGGELTEVTNLGEAVRVWKSLEPGLREVAILMLEHPVMVDGAPLNRFEGNGIKVLAERLPD